MATRNGWQTGCIWLAALLALPHLAVGQGIFLPASGAANRGMGGATTGTAIEAIGSMYWNPATISQLPTNEIAFSYEAIYTNYEILSAFPNVGSGATDAETGAMPVPSMAWVYHTCDPNVTVGMGINGVAGFAVNMRGDLSNPILSTPFSQGGVGVGGIKSEAVFFQMTPAVSIRLTDRLSLGFGPVIGMGKVAFDENIFAALNADFTYPRGDGTRYHWGLGGQIGFHYVRDCCWEFGVNLKSPTWFESMRYFSEDENGFPRTDTVNVSLPMVLSGGVAYKGFSNAILTCDVRYLDYRSTEGFGEPANYEANGRVSGLGWNDVFSVSVGAQVQLSERLIGRVGYIYASELFDGSATFFNLASDLSYRHVPTVGATYHLSESTSISLAYNYLIQWESSGPYDLPGIGPLPGTQVATEVDAHIGTIGINVRY